MKRAIVLTSILVAPALLIFDFWLATTLANWWNESFNDKSGLGGSYVGFLFGFALIGSQVFVVFKVSEGN